MKTVKLAALAATAALFVACGANKDQGSATLDRNGTSETTELNDGSVQLRVVGLSAGEVYQNLRLAETGPTGAIVGQVTSKAGRDVKCSFQALSPQYASRCMFWIRQDGSVRAGFYDQKFDSTIEGGSSSKPQSGWVKISVNGAAAKTIWDSLSLERISHPLTTQSTMVGEKRSNQLSCGEYMAVPNMGYGCTFWVHSSGIVSI